MFLNICKQTFHKSHMRISQKVKGVLMWNLQHIIFIWRRRYWQIFKSALVYLKGHSKLTLENSGQCLKRHPYRNVNQSSATAVLTKNKQKVKAYTLWRSRQKMTNFFCRLFFYGRLIFTNEYSYRHFFYKREHLVFSNLKIPLVYLFDFKFD